MEKNTLIKTLLDSRQSILAQLDEIPRSEMEVSGVVDQWSLKDLLVHMTRWEAELVKLLWQAKQGTKPTTVHFSQETVDEVNQRWYLESKSRQLDMVINDFVAVREQTIRRVKEYSQIELNDARSYTWLEERPLWEWIAEDSFRHEAEHAQQIQAWRRELDRPA